MGFKGYVPFFETNPAQVSENEASPKTTGLNTNMVEFWMI